MAMGTEAGRLGQVGQDRSGKLARARLATHLSPPTLEGQNFFVQTLFWVFLDSMEGPLSLDSSHVPMKGIR